MTDYYEDDEVFRDINSFYKRLMERMFREMQDFEKAIYTGQLQGSWNVKPINKPGVQGYVAQGRFQLGEPAQIPQRVFEDKREPLTDVFNEKDHIKIYIELPGIEKSEIQLNVTERTAEVKAKNFFKNIPLPPEAVDNEKAVANYKNGVLEVTLPKIKRAAEDEKKRRTIRIE